MRILAEVLREVLRRFDATVVYVRSFFDDPIASGKGSMARLSALLALLGALWTTRELVRFASAHAESVGMAGIIAGAATTLGATIVLGLLLRKKADGSTEPDDDASGG